MGKCRQLSQPAARFELSTSVLGDLQNAQLRTRNLAGQSSGLSLETGQCLRGGVLFCGFHDDLHSKTDGRPMVLRIDLHHKPAALSGLQAQVCAKP